MKYGRNGKRRMKLRALYEEFSPDDRFPGRTAAECLRGYLEERGIEMSQTETQARRGVLIIKRGSRWVKYFCV